MADELTIPKANPNLTATGSYQFLNRPMLSQYLESEYSIFGNPMYSGSIGMFPTGMGIGAGMMPGMMPGMGMMGMYGNYDQYIENMKKYNNGYYDIIENTADRQTSLTFDQRGNNYVLGTHSNILQQELVRLKKFIQNNDMRSACALYDRIYDNIAAAVGEELRDNSGRISRDDESIKNEIIGYYQNVNQSNLSDDIRANGSGDFATGWDEAWGDGQNSAKRTLSYMTNDYVQRSPWDKFCENAGHFFGDLLFGFFVDDGKSTIEKTGTY